MLTLFALIGTLLYLVGLVMIAAQVRVHAIRVNSRGSWVFRVGSILAAVGVLLVPEPWAVVARLLGLLSLPVAGLVGHHEWLQVRDAGATSFPWTRSLAVQVVLLGFGVVHTAGLIAQVAAQ
jgi:hypothetical protein